MRNIPGRLATLPIAVKVLLVVAAPIVLAIAVLLSPLLIILTALVLAVAVIALVIQLLRSGSLRRWGIVAAASLVLIFVFSGISNALYGGGGQTEQATSPEPTQEAERPKTTERAAEKDDQGDTAQSHTRAKQEPSQKPDREAQPPPSPEEKLADLGKVVAVSRVVDGDTVEVSPPVGGIADVRLIGVDTPETYGGSEPYGEEAGAFTTQRLEGRQVALEFDVKRIDPYGRVLAYVWLPDGKMFNEVLVREGYAQVATFPPNVKYVERFLAAQREARAEGAGLWRLPESRLCQLADRGNGIGGGCATEATPTASPSASPSASASASPSASPQAGAGFGGGGGNGNRGASAPAGGGDIDCDRVDGPIPTPPGDPDNLDGDNDGLACE